MGVRTKYQDRDKIRHLKGLKSIVVVVGGWSSSEISVCTRPLSQFTSVLCLVYIWLGYVRLRQFTSEGQDVELDNSRVISYRLIHDPFDLNLLQTPNSLHKELVLASSRANGGVQYFEINLEIIHLYLTCLVSSHDNDSMLSRMKSNFTKQCSILRIYQRHW